MFTAAWLTASLILIWIYRQLIYRRLCKTSWYSSYYVYLTVFQLAFFVWDCHNFVRYEVYKFDFLHAPPDFPADFPKQLRRALKITPLLRVFSFMAPISVLVSAALTTWHIRRHHLRIREIEKRLDGYPASTIRNTCHPHDLCIQVILLPLVYSLMAFKSVARMWMLTTGTVFESIDQYHKMKKIELEFYESNYYVADLYEAWALWCFSRLCVGTVRNKCVSNGWGKNARQLFTPLRKITLLGVESFVATYAITALYQLGISVAESSGNDVCVNFPAVCSFQGYTAGAGFLASCLALYNIVAFERYLEPYLHDFSPSLKFWGAKILVSLAFVQTLVLKLVFVDLLQWFSPIQQNLFYSSLICIECVFVTIMHVLAWKVDDTWCDEDSWRIDLDMLMTPSTEERVLRRENEKMNESNSKQNNLTKPLLKNVGGLRPGHC